METSEYELRRNAYSGCYKRLYMKDKKCEVCGCKTRLEIHHKNYKKPYSVRVLCKTCHTEIHKKMGTYNTPKKKILVTMSKSISITIPKKMYKQLTKYAIKYNNGSVSKTIRNAIIRYLAEEKRYLEEEKELKKLELNH